GQELHKRVAQVLEEQWPETAEAQPELLAQHWAQAGLAERAASYYLQAGARAAGRSAMAEAIAQLTKGLELVTKLPDAAPRWRQELELQIVLGQVLIVTQGYGAPAVGETYARARTLCELLARPPQMVPVLCGQYVYHLITGQLQLAQTIAADLLKRGEEEADAAITNLGHRISGAISFYLGELLTSRAHLEQALARFDPAHRSFYLSFS